VPGIIWWTWPLDELRRLKRNYGVRLAGLVHDLIPVRRPEFHTNEIGKGQFRRYLDAVLSDYDMVFATSDFVAADFADFARTAGRGDLPITRLGLCPDISPESPQRCTPRIAALGLKPDNYVLYVSTMNARKNHAGLYLLWRRLMDEMPEGRLPPLVFAGQKGAGTADFMRQLSRDKAAWGRTVIFLEAPTDEELAYLYANCAFTAFPSHYEGWGLAVTESLSFAKPCIAADNTSLREASQGLAIHIDTLDGLGWIAAIRRLVEDEPYRHQQIERISKGYRRRCWSEVADTILLASLGQTTLPADCLAKPI
jgi:glycosyltransferase involved in cell wall biosynthesis